ncbi:MAG: zinc ABC transporter substrate-binding protein [Clostridia bacterium]|nr:zinc ABC transporter substrate-binding protein [Clostridia bacterium]
MKKVRILAIAVLLFVLFVSGCGSSSEESHKISIVCTNFPVYDWVNNIIDKEDFQVTLLSGNGDIHSFQPTAKDMTRIRTCDLFIYVGGESDIWSEKFVNENGINSLKLFDLLKSDLLCGDENHPEHEHHDEEPFDEHIWLSLKLAQKAVDGIYEKLMEAVPEIQSEQITAYRKRKDELKAELEQLDIEYTKAVEGSKDKTIVVADRFPFLYMTSDYNISSEAAFSGCSTDQDAGFDVIVKLTQTVEKLDKKAVVVLEKSNSSVAKTIKENSNNSELDIVVMNSCQTIGNSEIEAGISYIEIMEENLEALKKALE